MTEHEWDKLLKIRTSGRDDSHSDQYRFPYEPTPYPVLERLAGSGYITKMDTSMIGRASQETGAGRMFKGQPLDFGAGIIMKKRTGDAIATGEALAIVYSESKEKCDSAAVFLQKAITIEDKPAAEQPPLIWKIIRQED